MTDYPDWVMKYKTKGTYVNKVKDKYYLYAAHSERIPGTKKVRRVSDGYLGRITPEGFIPTKKKLENTIFVYEYGLSKTIIQLSKNIYTGLKREFRENTDPVFVRGILMVMHGNICPICYGTSWLSQFYPDHDMTKEVTPKQQTGIQRAERMIIDILKKHFGAEYEMALRLLPLIRKVRMNKEEKLAHVPEEICSFAQKHGLEFGEEVEPWQN